MAEAAPPRGFHHLAICVRDLDAVEPFYRDVLALPVMRRWPAEGSAADAPPWRSVWLDTGDGGFLALERVSGGVTAAEAPERWADPGLHLVALRITAAERTSWEARLAAAGVAITHRTAYTLYVRDPEGNAVGLSHWPHAAADQQGG